MQARTEGAEQINEVLQEKIDQLCKLAANKDTTREQIEKFFAENPDVDVDGHDTENSMRAIDYAAQSGNAVVFKYLHKNRKADLTHADDSPTSIDSELSDEDDIPTTTLSAEIRQYTDEHVIQPSPIYQFCDLAGNKSKSKEDIQEFLIKNPDFDINTAHPETNIRPVFYALQRGSISSFKYLVEDLNADLTSNGPLTHVMMITINDSSLKKYIANNKLWRRLNNGTTDLHGYAWCGNIKALLEELNKNPDRISVLSDDDRSIFTWANKDISKKLEAWVAEYVKGLTGPNDKEKLRDFNLCMAYTYCGVGKNDLAITAFSLSLSLHQELSHSLTTNTSDFSDRVNRKLASIYSHQLANMDVALHEDQVSAKQKYCLEALTSIQNKTLEDYSNYILYSCNFANAYGRAMKKYSSISDKETEDYPEKTISKLIIALQLLQNGLTLVSTFPDEIITQMQIITGAVEFVENTMLAIITDQESLNSKITFISEVFLFSDPKSTDKKEKEEKKGKEEKKDDEVEEEEEKKIPYQSYASSRAYPGVLYPYPSSTRSNASSSSRTPQPPPKSPDDDFRSLHLR